ncbi:hypothetical protein [Candidatus Spongiihabitans sp.]
MPETFWIRGMTKKGNRHNEFGYAERFNNWIPACGENDGLGGQWWIGRQ